MKAFLSPFNLKFKIRFDSFQVDLRLAGITAAFYNTSSSKFLGCACIIYYHYIQVSSTVASLKLIQILMGNERSSYLQFAILNPTFVATDDRENLSYTLLVEDLDIQLLQDSLRFLELLEDTINQLNNTIHSVNWKYSRPLYFFKFGNDILKILRMLGNLFGKIKTW